MLKLASMWGRLYAPLLIFFIPALANAAAFTPETDDFIVETLPQSSLFKNSEIEILRQKLKTNPHNIDVAAQLARLYIQTGRQQSDPRYFGYAQSVLSPWWQNEFPPKEVLFLRANLNQGLHAFLAAENDLKKLVRQNRRDHQAWWLLATVYLAQGKYSETEASCSALTKVAHQVISSLCYAMVLSRTGKAEKAYELLVIQQAQLKGNQPLYAWSTSLKAEISSQLRLDKQIEKDFEDALTATGEAPYLLKVYCDYLLEHGKHEQIISITESWTHDLALAIRLAIAHRELGNRKKLGALKQQIRSTLELEVLRGSKLHQREAAYYQLAIERDFKNALLLANKNWQAQKEPEDALILLKAAIAAEDNAAISLVKSWMLETQLQDQRIQTLLNRQALI